MKRLTGWRRWLTVAGLVVVAAVLVVRQALVWGGATRLIAGGLQDQFGGRVSLASSRVPLLGSASVSGLKLYEADHDEPFLEARRVVADVSAVGYLFGRRPDRLEVDDAQLRLRFDAAGNLLTRFEVRPSEGELPAVRLRDSRLTIEQEGRPAFTLAGVTLDFHPGEEHNLTGEVADPAWGPLAVAGTVDPQTMAVALTLTHQGLDLDVKKLRALPLAPPALWNQIELEGRSIPLRLTLATASTRPRIRYRAEFSRLGIRLPQPDRPAFTAGPAHGVLEGNEDGLNLKGAANDPSWGKWNFAAQLITKTGAIHVDLDTPNVQVEQKQLEALPYVPKNVWQQIRKVRGRTAVQIQLDLSMTRPDLHYRVELKGPQTQVEVTALDLMVDHASGGVLIEDGRVLLENVHAAVAGGKIALGGFFDFRKEPARLHFKVKASDLVLAQLPKKWGLPSQVEGKLVGAAELAVRVYPDRLVTQGTGKGQIVDARVLGMRTSEPIQLTLESDKDGLRFLTPSAVLNTLISLVRSAPRATAPPAPPPAAKQSSLEPDHLASQVKDGVGWAAGKVAEGTTAALASLGQAGRALKPGKKTTYLNARVALDNIDLGELLRRAGVELPKDLPVAGRVSVRVQLGIPINKATDSKAYRLDGTATSEGLNVAGIEFGKLTAHVNYRDGVLRLEKLAGLVRAMGAPSGSPSSPTGGGTFAGTARADVFPRGDLTLNLDMTRLPLGSLQRLVPGGGRFLAGTVSGKVTASTPLADLATPQKWRGKASLRGAVVEVRGLAVRDLSANVALGDGKLSVADLRGEVAGAPLRGSATLSLLDKQPVSGHLSVRGLDVSVLRPLLPASWQYLKPSGRADLTADLAGTLNPVALGPRGRLEARGLGFDGVRASRLSMGWSIRGQTLDLQNIDARLYRGRLAGTASVPLAGEDRPLAVNLKLDNIDVEPLARALGGLPVPLAGRLSGQAKLTMRPTRAGWEGSALVTSPRLTVRGIPATQVRGSVKWAGSRADFRIDGDLLGGTFSIDGSYPPPPMRPVGRYDGRLQLRRILLGQVGEALGLGQRLAQLDGVGELELPFRFDGPGGAPVGQGRFALRDVRWGDAELTDSVIGTVRLGREGFFVGDVSAELAGGLLRFGAAYRFRDPQRSWFSLNLSRADLGRLAAYDPDLKDRFSGPVDVMLRGTLGDEWRGSGSVALMHGRAFGVEVSEWRIPLDFTFSPGQQRLELVVRESGAQLGAGRAIVNATLLWAGSMRLEGDVRLIDAALKSLSGLTGDISSYATGRVNGRVVFAGSDMHSINDLTASVDAKLRDTQALQLPVLSVLTPYLMPGQGATTFSTGDLKGRLGGGVFRISTLTLEAPVAHLMIQGNVALAGRLDLDVVTRTTPLGGVNPVLARLLLARVPAVGPVPVGLILQATNLFANRVVHLQVTGTLRNPVVQVKPLQLLSDEALRYFLLRAAGTNPSFP
jgi:hypothetical protein